MSNVNLENLLKESGASFNVNGTDTYFYSLYDSLRSSLAIIHADVTGGAILADIEENIKKANERLTEIEQQQGDITEVRKIIVDYEKIRWLNDHGPNHIKCVIKRVSHLVNGNMNLSPREIFCLLSAIQLHDIGNIFGRIGHENRIKEVIADSNNKIGSDHIEKKYITQIAQVHGGKVASTGSKDTIRELKNTAPVMDENIRLRLLAALVRFADELADERNRANLRLLQEGKIPKSSEVYHAYSSIINSVLIDHEKGSIEIHFDIPKEFLSRKFGKDSGETYLIEEVYERTLKMHREKIYCSRFWKPYLDIESIVVIINFFDENSHGEVLPEISYTLRERGYPNEPSDIFQLCSDSLYKDGQKMDGKYFEDQLTPINNDKE